MLKTESFAEWWQLHKDELMQNEQVGVREIAEVAWKASRTEVEKEIVLFTSQYTDMRQKQNNYFRGRSRDALVAARTAETEMDRTVKGIQERQSSRQMSFILEAGK